MPSELLWRTVGLELDCNAQLSCFTGRQIALSFEPPVKRCYSQRQFIFHASYEILLTSSAVGEMPARFLFAIEGDLCEFMEYRLWTKIRSNNIEALNRLRTVNFVKNGTARGYEYIHNFKRKEVSLYILNAWYVY